MGDTEAKASSAPRQNPMIERPIHKSIEADAISKLISEYEYSSPITNKEKVDLLKKVETALNRNSQNCPKAPKFIANLLTNPDPTIRKTAFTCALLILSNPNNPKSLLLDSYRLAMCCSNLQVAQYSLSLLPDFINVCPEETSNLIKFGVVAHNRLPAPSTELEVFLSKSLSAASK